MKTYSQINQRISEGNAVVMTKHEFLQYVKENGIRKSATDVDVVTTGTFGPMCSSGVFLNFGHSKPKIKIGGGSCLINGVPAYAGLAAVDVYVGATASRKEESHKKPRQFSYGGGHLIHDLVSGKEVEVSLTGYGTDCYPRKRLRTRVTLADINEAILCNPRNAYQNYNCAVNLSKRTLYTYMGILKPELGNANYCSACELSPLFNDPLYLTIGVGTRIFLGGGIGYVFSHGTQHNPDVLRSDNGTPRLPAGTLALIGDLKQMKPEWLIGMSIPGYGTTLRVGVGIPIPILNEDMARFASVRDDEIFTQVVDYSRSYPLGIPETLGEVSYANLKSGRITLRGKEVPAANLSNYHKAIEISKILKDWILKKRFKLVEPIELLPSAGSGYRFKPMRQSPRGKKND